MIGVFESTIFELRNFKNKRCSNGEGLESKDCLDEECSNELKGYSQDEGCSN